MKALQRIWRSGAFGKIGLGCGALVALLFSCGVCSIVVALVSPTPAKTAAVLPTPTAHLSVVRAADTGDGGTSTPTAIPTERPEVLTALALATQIARPTQTAASPPTAVPLPPPAEPTRTSLPSTTPQPPTEIPSTPTADVAAQNQADVRVYFAKVGPIVGKLGPALGEVGRLASEVGDKPALLFDQDWKIELAGQMAIVKTSNTDILAIQPVPGPAQEFHDLLTKATQTCSDSMDTLAKGLDTLNATTIERASAQMTDCNVKTRIATAKMPRLP